MEKFIVSLYQAGKVSVGVEQKPDMCPICHHALNPEFVDGFADPNKIGTYESVQLVFRCTRQSCHRLFIAYYRAHSASFTSGQLGKLLPVVKENRNFVDIIKQISPTFVDIYNQSYHAEQVGLDQIAGVGYRKAMEFLVKDYLVDKLPDDKEVILKTNLGTCIEKYVQSPQVKSVSKRAVWLGNDETHYVRKFEDKDIKDLKSLIDLTLHWIEMEKLTESITAEMQPLN